MQLSGIAGWLSDRFPVGGVRWAATCLWSGATIATGLVTGFTTLFLARLLLGAGESVAYPCYSRVFAELRKSIADGPTRLIDAGTKLGPAMGAFCRRLLLVHFGWRVLFVVLEPAASVVLPGWR